MTVMLDCGTAGGNLISKTQIDLQGFKTRNLSKPIKLRTAIKGSYCMIHKVADLEIDWQGYHKITRTFFVAPLDGVDAIIGIKQLGDMKSKANFAEREVFIQQGSKPDFKLKILPAERVISTAYTRIEIPPSDEENTSTD